MLHEFTRPLDFAIAFVLTVIPFTLRYRREYVFKQMLNPFRSSFGFLFSDVRNARRSCLEVKLFAQRVLEHYRRNPNKSPQNTLIKLIESNEDFSDEMKVSELFVYILAGHDTTGYRYV